MPGWGLLQHTRHVTAPRPRDQRRRTAPGL